MKVLLDEDVPAPVLEVLRHLLRGHSVDYVGEMSRWRGKKDIPMIRDAAAKGYDVLITNNVKQFEDPDETDAIRRSRIHHVVYRQRHPGMKGLGLAIGSLTAAMPMVLVELEAVETQRLVKINSLDPTRRYEVTDPRKDPPRYWRR